jgi:hypothetical protein
MVLVTDETVGALVEGAELEEMEFSDEELTALALASDVDEPLSPDAVPLDLYASQDGGFLPAWYMPPVTARRARHWRVPVVWVVIAAFLLIDAFGLCICYGQLVAA